MRVVNGIAYANNEAQLLKVVSAKALSDFRLWLRFSNGDTRVFDASDLLRYPAFKELSDPKLFGDVYLDYGVPTWLDGRVDLAPEMLYENSVTV